MLPAQLPGAFPSTINYLKISVRLIPSDGALNSGNVRLNLQKPLWRKQGSNLQPQGCEPCELPIAPFRSQNVRFNTFYNTKINIITIQCTVYQIFNIFICNICMYYRVKLTHIIAHFADILRIIGSNSNKKKQHFECVLNVCYHV